MKIFELDTAIEKVGKMQIFFAFCQFTFILMYREI